MLRFLLVLLLALVSFAAQAMTAMFYQPQLRDMQVPESDWPHIFKSARDHGLDTVIVQWTRYGDAFSTSHEKEWLRRRIVDARRSGLGVVVGLVADPDFYVQQGQTGRALERYLSRQRQQDKRLASDWLAILGVGNIAGWYLTAEIDDYRWQDLSARAILLDHLRKQRDGLRSLASLPIPVHVSSFFVGNMPPIAYHDLVRALSGTGVRVLVQDGAGTGKLALDVRTAYLDMLSQCGYDPVSGIVFEIFRQTGPDEAFVAERLSESELSEAIAQRAACAGDSVFFELRYLRALDGWLPL